MDEVTIRNATITNATITTRDHNILSAWLFLDYSSGSQGFGGCALYTPMAKVPFDVAGFYIWRVMEVVGVTDWDQLVGKNIRVRGNHNGIEAIGHILKDVWFNPQEEFAAAKNPNPPA